MEANWTPEQIPDLTGKVIVITGANSGIGYQAARELSRKGGEVVFACRDLEKAAAAMDRLGSELTESKTVFMELDLARLDSVREFADQFRDQYRSLDVLLNNAGIMLVPYGLTEDGFECNLGVNHLGHFALTGLLMDRLVATPGSRVVTISSNAHFAGEMDFSNLLYQRGVGYQPMKAYSRSKLANLLFAYELQRRFEAKGFKTISLAAHPGIANTALADHVFERWYGKPLRPVLGLLVQSAAMGALPGIRAAMDPEARGGQYYGPGGKGGRSGYPVVVESNQASHHEDDARKLWAISEELTGVRYFSQ